MIASVVMNLDRQHDLQPRDSGIARWIEQTATGLQGPPLSPGAIAGNEFPLRTLPSLPSDSSLSDHSGDLVVPDRNVATLIHPPTPTMTDEQTAARRRSSSLVGATVPPKKAPRRHSRPRSDQIAEEGGQESSDAERSDSESHSDSTDYHLDGMSADGLDDDEETGLTKRDRRRRRRRKRRNTLLDQRIVPEGTYTKEEKKLADQSIIRSMLVNAVFIVLW